MIGEGVAGTRGRSLCDFIEDVDCGDVEESAGREEHGDTCDGELDHVHDLILWAKE